MNKPLVSVVMVVRNVDCFLAESIESILAQTFRNFEFIIVDFGSTDKSKSIIESYAAKDSRIKFHEIPPCDLTVARNAACRFALGRYIAIMDADDVCVSNRLKWEVEFMEMHPEVGLLGGATEWVDATGQFLCTTDFPPGDKELRIELENRCAFCQPTVLIRNEAFVLTGGYREILPQAEDYDLWLRIIEHFQCANLKQVVLKYRIHPNQVSMQRRKQQSLCVLAVQLSASARRNGHPDPLSSFKEITEGTLGALGVTAAEQERKIVLDSWLWIRNMGMAGQHSVALKAALDVLQTEWKYVEKWQIAALYLTIARIYWGQKKVLRCFLAAGRAVAIRPQVVGRPLRPLLQRLGLA